MIALVLRRLIQAVIVMVVVAFIAVLHFQHVGDPAVFLLGQHARPAQIEALRAGLRPDKPLFVRFGLFLTDPAQGESGLSLWQGAKGPHLVVERVATLEAAVVPAVLA